MQETGRSSMTLVRPPAVERAINRQIADIYVEKMARLGVVLTHDDVMATLAADSPLPMPVSQPVPVAPIAAEAAPIVEAAPSAAAASAVEPVVEAPVGAVVEPVEGASTGIAGDVAAAPPNPVPPVDGDPKPMSPANKSWVTRRGRQDGTIPPAPSSVVETRGVRAFKTKLANFRAKHPEIQTEEAARTAMMKATSDGRSRKAKERKARETRAANRRIRLQQKTQPAASNAAAARA